MSESSSSYDGPERRKNPPDRRRDPIHPWRWRGLTIWIIVFTALTFWAIRSVESQSATVTELQKTNCGLEQFLLTARATRWQAYLKNHNLPDLEAVVGYERLVRPFVDSHEATGHCPIPKRLIIKSRPLHGIQ